MPLQAAVYAPYTDSSTHKCICIYMYMLTSVLSWGFEGYKGAPVLQCWCRYVHMYIHLRLNKERLHVPSSSLTVSRKLASSVSLLLNAICSATNCSFRLVTSSCNFSLALAVLSHLFFCEQCSHNLLRASTIHAKQTVIHI